MAHLDQQSAERKRTAAAAAAAAQKVSKNIEEQEKKIQELMQPAKRPRPENVVQSSLGQNVYSAGTSTQQFKPQQSILKVGVSNPYQAALTQNVLPAITKISQLVAGSHRPVGIQNQALAVPPQYGSGSLANYYGVASTGPYRSNTLAPGPGALNGPSAQASSRSKLYSGDPLAAVSRSSDKKGSSYKYSLSSMSTYDHKWRFVLSASGRTWGTLKVWVSDRPLALCKCQVIVANKGPFYNKGKWCGFVSRRDSPRESNKYCRNSNIDSIHMGNFSFIQSDPYMPFLVVYGNGCFRLCSLRFEVLPLHLYADEVRASVWFCQQNMALISNSQCASFHWHVILSLSLRVSC